jgi:hypothetical protein
MNYVQIYQAIQDYSENTEALFVNNIPVFVKQAEDRIYNSVQIPSLRKNVTGLLTASNPYLSAPPDYLSTYSLAVIDPTGNYNYLINKDVNFIREAYPTATALGEPKYYSLFGSQYSNPNEMSFLLGPTPDINYNAELHYFYYPVSIVQGALQSQDNTVPSGTITNGGSLYTNGTYENVPLTGGSGSGATATIVVTGQAITSCTVTNGGNFYVVGDVLSVSPTSIANSNVNASGFAYTIAVIPNPTGYSWLGDNYDPVLFYGAMREAMLFMKGEQDLVGYYEQKYQEAIQQLNRLGSGLERGDAYRDGQYRIGQVKP